MKNRNKAARHGKLSKHTTANKNCLARAMKMRDRSICGEVR